MPRPAPHPALQDLPRDLHQHLNECKPWRGAIDAQGYPRQKVLGQSVYIHRRVYEEFWGRLEPGERVYRTCGRRECVNGYHVTTEQPERKRWRPGTTKLSVQQVRAIRKAWAQPGRPTQAELAAKYGVSRSCISLVVRGMTWPHV